MGPSKEALDLARYLLQDDPKASEKEIDLAYELQARGQEWVEKHK